MAESLKQKTVNGMMWSAVEKFSTSGINFVFNMLIARILLPSDYGMVAMLGIFLAVSNCFIDSGFANALIRKTDRTEADYNTMFYFNMGVAVAAYLILFFSAPLIAKFYKTPMLVSITRLVGLNLVIGSVTNIQGIQLTIRLDFRARAIISLIGCALSGAVGLWMAYNGYGVMAIVFQGLTLSVVKGILIWAYVKWKPALMFSKKSFKEMFSFGSKLLASNLIDTVYNNIYTLVIGKVYSPTALGNYSKADNLAQFPSAGMSGVIQSVSYPALSTIQNDAERLRASFRKFIRMTALINFPMMIGMAAVADPFIRFCLTDKWEASIIFLRLLCIAYLLWPIHVLDMNILQVKGRSDYYLRLEILRKILGVIILIATIPFGLKVMCIGVIVSSIVSLPLSTYYTRKEINYSLRDQLVDIAIPFIASTVMGIIVYIITRLIASALLSLIIGVVVGAIIYYLILRLVNYQEVKEVMSIVKSRL